MATSIIRNRLCPHSLANIDLDLDRHALQADHGAAVDFRKHVHSSFPYGILHTYILNMIVCSTAQIGGMLRFELMTTDNRR